MANQHMRISSKLQTVGDIFRTDARYKVPAYQRDFSWTQEEVKQLWDDLIEAMEQSRPDYFLGTIVVTEQGDEKVRNVIDGQQRLATLTIMLSAIRAVYQEHGDERAREIYFTYLGSRDRETRIAEPRVTLNRMNEPTFQQLVADYIPTSKIEEVVKDKTTAATNVLLGQATLDLRKSVMDRSLADSDYARFLIRLERFIIDHVVLILVEVGDDADAYLVFETLNDRGLDLSVSDLLKNYIYGKAGRQLDTVQKQWEEMTTITGSKNVTQFLRHYWLSKFGVVRERDLYKELRYKFRNQTKVLELIHDLRNSADAYAALYNVDHTIWQDYGTSVRSDLEVLELFNLSQFRPLLLAALQTLDKPEVEKVISIVVVLSMRYNIIGSLSTGNLEKAYSDAAVAMRRNTATTAAKVFSLLRRVCPDDAQFIADFASREITKPKIARYILREIANRRQESPELRIQDDEKQVDLEHIVPKNMTQDWTMAAADDEQYLRYVSRLGNLTLVERGQNRATGGASFATKKDQIYSRSHNPITRELCEYDSWTVKEIAARQQKLAEDAAVVWSLPYQ